MKILLITGLSILLLSGPACSNQKSGQEPPGDQSGNQSEIRFEKTEHNLGNILQGEKVGYNFLFTNVGDASLVIMDASASCGCTVPRYSRKPIPPGGDGSVEVVFDSSGRMGRQTKTVTLKTNGKNKVVHLTIKANITIKKS
jgi:hypothetical protein